MVPQAGVVALQGVQAGGDLMGKSVLINGAGGGTGTFAIQLAKLMGAARVTAVDRGAKADEMLRLGADEAVDYTRDDYTVRRDAFDLVLDIVGSRRLADNARVLTPNGRYFLAGGPLSRILAAVTFGAIRSLVSTRKYRLLIVKQSPAAFLHVAELCVRGQLRPVLGKTLPLTEVRDAFRLLETGSVFGKIVITL
jgi:NADPH:quinone reductase-like Zn-dependent oxidoreductase